MKLTKENILSVCGKYLFVFYKNEEYGYWENDSPSEIYAINNFGFVCTDGETYYFNHYLGDDCRLFISCKGYNNYASLEDMNSLEEVDKESLKNLVEELNDE